MNRIEFMTELASLLQDVPAEERRDAMQYYNDYFDDAGEDQEQQVIEELESPKKVAEKIKADMAGFREEEEKPNMPAMKEPEEQNYQQTPPGQNGGNQASSKSDRTLKIILIIAIALCALPIILPVGGGILCLVLCGIISVFALFLALVVAAAAIAITGIGLFISGLLCVVPELAVGFALMGIGMIITVIGVAAFVGAVKLCAVAIPGICRGIVWILRRPFQRKAVG